MSFAKVKLYCRNEAAGTKKGYTATTSDKGTTYFYKYKGGTDGKGGVTFTTGSGVSVLQLTVGKKKRYQIDSITFKGGDTTDLSWTHGETPARAFIVDTDIDDLNDEYSIVVVDTKANATFTCDPPIKNEPPR